MYALRSVTFLFCGKSSFDYWGICESIAALYFYEHLVSALGNWSCHDFLSCHHLYIDSVVKFTLYMAKESAEIITFSLKNWTVTWIKWGAMPPDTADREQIAYLIEMLTNPRYLPAQKNRSHDLFKKIFAEGSRTCAGIAEFEHTAEAAEVVTMINHEPVKSECKRRRYFFIFNENIRKLIRFISRSMQVNRRLPAAQSYFFTGKCCYF